MSEPLVVGIAIASVAGFLAVAAGTVFFLARTLREQYDREDTEDPPRSVYQLGDLQRSTKCKRVFHFILKICRSILTSASYVLFVPNVVHLQ